MKHAARVISLSISLLVFANHFSLAILSKGDKFLPFSLKAVDEKIYTVKMEEARLVVLTESRVNGKTAVRKIYPDAVLLDFWATWCVPCRAAMPFMQKIYERFLSDAGQESGGLLLLGISLDQTGSKVVKPFYTKLKITYPMLADPAESHGKEGMITNTREMSSQYRVQEIPVVYLIDSNGIIEHSHLGFRKEEMAGLEAIIQGLIQEKRK
jgi:thiol-disulfide isomerase/thioredoxin